MRRERRNKLYLLIGLGGISLLLIPFSCQKRPRPDRFILVTLDTQRADHISAYNPVLASTPNVDSLAKDGVLFKNAYSLIPITLPAHASIFFSEPPHEILNYNNGQTISRRRSRPSLVNLFRKRGFLSAAFVSLGVLLSRYGLDEGFALYVDEFPRDRWYLSAEEINQRVFPWLEENKEKSFFLWIHYSDPHDPYAPPYLPNDFKLFLNEELVLETCLDRYSLNEVNLNLRPGRNQLRLEVDHKTEDNPDHFQARLDRLEFSPPLDESELGIDLSRGWFIRTAERVYFFKGRSQIDLYLKSGLKNISFTFRGKLLYSAEDTRKNYRKEVEYMDAQIGRLWDKLRELELYDRTAILLVGDHGEGLGERRNVFGDPHFGHIHYLYNEYTKVPLILRDPFSNRKGIIREEIVTLLDIAPTISAVMGFEKFPHYQGRNLLRLKRPRKKETPVIFMETFSPEADRDRFALLSFPWQLIFTPQDSKYELYNLGYDPEESEDLFSKGILPPDVVPLKKSLDVFSREVLGRKKEPKIDKQTQEMLRALGYIR